MILRTYCLLSLGLEFVVGLVFVILQIFGRHGFSMQCRAIIGSSGHWSVFYLKCQAECSNLMNSAGVRTSSTGKSDLLVPICLSLHALLHPIQLLLAIDGTADPSNICLEFLCNFRLVHLSSFGIVSMG